MTDIPHLQEKVLAGNLLTAGAAKASAALDSFASWLLGGFGAALALVLSSDAALGKYVLEEDLRCAGVLFLWAATLTIVEKYLAAVISGAAETASLAAEAGRRLADDGVEVDFLVVFQELQSAVVWPARWFVVRSHEKALRGDFASSGKNFLRCAQAQGLLVLTSAVLLLIAIGVLVRGFEQPDR